MVSCRPYWLSVATTADMLSVGVWLPAPIEAAFLAQVAAHNEALGTDEPFLSAWHCRPVRANLLSAVGLYERLHFVREHPPMMIGVHGQAVAIDQAARLDPAPVAWHAQFVERHAQDTGCVPFSVCLLGGRTSPHTLPWFFSNLTQQVIARIRAMPHLRGYGFDCLEENQQQFLPVIAALADFRQRLLVRSRNQWVDWEAFDHFMADTQALVLRHSSASCSAAPALQRL